MTLLFAPKSFSRSSSVRTLRYFSAPRSIYISVPLQISSLTARVPLKSATMADRDLANTSIRTGSSSAEYISTDGQVNELHDRVAKVAERFSISSGSGELQSQVLNPTPGSKLDPSSPTFDARVWVKEFIRLTESDPQSAPSRSLGVAFKELGVFAYTTAAEYQKTTGNVVIGLATYLARWLRGNPHGRRVDILRNFEGVAEKGEMVLVLGPPGSGCSTLLKTLSGETADLNITPESYINFRGLFLIAHSTSMTFC